MEVLHQEFEAIGFYLSAHPLDSYGVTGKWRVRENGNPLDTRGDFYDGTPINNPTAAAAAAAAATTTTTFRDLLHCARFKMQVVQATRRNRGTYYQRL